MNVTIKTNENFQSLLTHLKAKGTAAQQRAEASDSYQQFISVFPLERLNQLTLDEYCVGKGDGASFCWWIERGLESALGRYMPGTARGHMLYFQDDGSLYKHRHLQGLSDEMALRYALKIQSTIAAADPKDMLWVDNDKEIHRRAGEEPRLTIAPGRKLRLLSCYHPEHTLPISSSRHIIHYLQILGCPQQDIPAASSPVACLLKLREYYQLACEFVPDLSPFGFIRGLYSDELKLAPSKEDSRADHSLPDELELDIDTLEQDSFMNTQGIPLNQLFFGPPGTGKTYATVEAALEVLDPTFRYEQKNNRNALKHRFDELVEQDRIRFVTFHQSFSYEDFVEGLRACVDETSQQLSYEVVDGVFKSLCAAAAAKVTQQTEAPLELGKRRIWKMSLGNTLGEDASVYQECLAGGYILLGYGEAIDFSGCMNRQQVQARFAEDGVIPVNPATDYGITSVTAFVSRMKVGDLIVVSDGNFKFRAIGEVTGDYQLKPHSELEGYSQMRPVKWLREYQPSLPHSELLSGQFSQMTLYELRSPSLDMGKLDALLGQSDEVTDARVLIIDEINRGNISRIFGELITLIEPTKRAGAEEALSVILPYSKQSFSVPNNLYLIGTMNTADRSLAGLDIALRRRFMFREMPPRPDLLNDVEVSGLNLGKLLKVMNQRIEVLLDRDHCLGHAYFMPLKSEPTIVKLETIFRNQVLPLLQEYFFEDWERIAWVLNDQHAKDTEPFIQRPHREQSLTGLFGHTVADKLNDQRWELNDRALSSLASYQNILG